MAAYLSDLRRIILLKKDWDRVPPTLTLVCIVLLASGMSSADGGYFVGDWVPPTIILAALTLLVSILGLTGHARLRWSAFLALSLFTMYTAWTFASLLWSPNMGDAWLGAGQTLLYLLAFWLTVVLVALGASLRWALVASVLGPAVVAAFTLLSLVPQLEYMFVGNRLVGTVGYYNGEAAFLLVPFWVAVYLGGSAHINPILRGAALVSACLSTDLAVLTQSRGAMAAMIASVPVFFLLSGQRLRGLLALVPIAAALYVSFPDLNAIYQGGLAPVGQEASIETLLSLVLPTVWLTATLAGVYGLCWGLIDRRWRLPSIVVRVAGGILLAGCLVFLIASATVLTEREGDPVTLVQQKWEAFSTGDRTGEEQSRYLSASGSGRSEYWRAAWKAFVRHPVLGVGTQNYEATYYQLREQHSGPVRQPHALPLEVLSERGIVGGMLFFGFLATCLARGLQKRYGILSSERKAQVGALVAGVAYWFVHSSSEWFWQIPAVTLPAIVYLGLLVSPWRPVGATPEPPGRLFGWPLRAGGISAAVLAVAVIIPLYAADYYLERSRTASESAEGLAMVERAQRFNPLDPKLLEREADLAIETGDGERVEDAYERAIRLNPEHYAPYMRLAKFYEQRGESEKALFYYRKASTLNPLSGDLNQRAREINNASAGKE